MYNVKGGIKLPAASRADRRIANASKGHCTAFAVLGENEGYRVQAESHLELCNLLLLNASGEVERLKEQALFEWEEGGRIKRHYFDVLALLKSGARIAYTVKPEKRASSERFLSEMRVIAGYAVHSGFCCEVRLVTERSFCQVDLRNAAIFATVRPSEFSAEAEHKARKVTEDLVGSVTLRDLSTKIGMAACGYRALLCLVRRGVLRQSRHEVLSPEALVHAVGGEK